jgi:hypothetical protein
MKCLSLLSTDMCARRYCLNLFNRARHLSLQSGRVCFPYGPTVDAKEDRVLRVMMWDQMNRDVWKDGSVRMLCGYVSCVGSGRGGKEGMGLEGGVESAERGLKAAVQSYLCCDVPFPAFHSLINMPPFKAVSFAPP